MKQVAGYIQRKSMLYETGVEYGDYTMNHVQGCAHGCLYPCYAFLQKKRFGQVKTYENWLKPHLVSNTMELLRREIPKLRDKIQSVQLCFTTDPFMYDYDEICNMSLDSIELLNESGIKCTVLTKGVLPIALADRQRFPEDNEYGITLISLDEEHLAALQSDYDFYTETVIPAGTYAGVEEDVVTVSVRAALVASNEVGESVIYELVKAMFDNKDALTGMNAKFEFLNPEDAVKGMDVPFHAGAKKYYEEQGIAVE